MQCYLGLAPTPGPVPVWLPSLLAPQTCIQQRQQHVVCRLRCTNSCVSISPNEFSRLAECGALLNQSHCLPGREVWLESGHRTPGKQSPKNRGEQIGMEGRRAPTELVKRRSNHGATARLNVDQGSPQVEDRRVGTTRPHDPESAPGFCSRTELIINPRAALPKVLLLRPFCQRLSGDQRRRPNGIGGCTLGTPQQLRKHSALSMQNTRICPVADDQRANRRRALAVAQRRPMPGVSMGQESSGGR